MSWHWNTSLMETLLPPLNTVNFIEASAHPGTKQSACCAGLSASQQPDNQLNTILIKNNVFSYFRTQRNTGMEHHYFRFIWEGGSANVLTYDTFSLYNT